MKKRIAAVLLVLVMAMQLAACGSTCKANGCNEEIYKDGYCTTHYYLNAGGNILNELFK